MQLPFRSRRVQPPLEPEEAYALWAPGYEAQAHNDLMRIEQAEVVSLLPSRPVSLALDLGCGTGRYSAVLAARQVQMVTGVDRSAAMLSRASGHDLVRADFRSLPFQARRADLIVSGLALMDVPDLAATLVEWARVLDTGGTLVYSVLHPRGQSLGWTRTFDSSSGRHVVRAHWHSQAEHLDALRNAGLSMDQLREPGGEAPVALVVRASKAR